MARVSVAVHTRVRVRVGAGGGGSLAAAAVLFVAAMIAISSSDEKSDATSVEPSSTVTLPSRIPPAGAEEIPDQHTSVAPPRGDTVHRSRATASCAITGHGTVVRVVNTSSQTRTFRVLVNHQRTEDGRYLSNDVATFPSIKPGGTGNATLPTPSASLSVSCRIRAVSDS